MSATELPECREISVHARTVCTRPSLPPRKAWERGYIIVTCLLHSLMHTLPLKDKVHVKYYIFHSRTHGSPGNAGTLFDAGSGVPSATSSEPDSKRSYHGYMVCSWALLYERAARVKHSTHEQTYLVHVSLATHNQWTEFLIRNACIVEACIVVVCLFQGENDGRKELCSQNDFVSRENTSLL